MNEIFCCRGQAEKEFRVEVEAIGHVRHKNLVRLLGYCIEGVQRLASLELYSFGLGSNFLSVFSCLFSVLCFLR